MTKIRKQKKKKTFRYGVNRKRLNRKLHRQPKIKCSQIKQVWDNKKSMKKNLKQMGLAIDPNEVIKIPSNKPTFIVREVPDDLDLQDKSHVADEIEEDAKAPRERVFRLPKNQVHWLSKLIDTYGEDYKAMARDPKLNMFQETWRKLRAKIKQFKGIPEQYNEYLKSKELQE